MIESVTNWMCKSCGNPLDWCTGTTACCKAFAISAYSQIPCICSNQIGNPQGWLTYTDGYTRQCGCGFDTLGRHPALPNPDKSNGLCALLFSAVLHDLFGESFLAPTFLKKVNNENTFY